MSRPLTFIFIIGIIASISIGCSSAADPTQPAAPTQQRPVADVSTSNVSLWGFWDVSFNPDSLEFDITPLRNAMFQANVTRFLQPPSSPINLLTIQFLAGSDLSNGLVVCNVSIQHPFMGYPKWRGFDVMGIVMGNASTEGIGTGEIYPAPDELRILNPDGYTRWWNPTEFTTYETIFGYTEGAKSIPGFYADSTINGYKYFSDSLDSEAGLDELDLDSRGTFGTDPGINTRRYEIQFPLNPSTGNPDFRFNYAITASYAGPISEDDPDYPIEVFPEEANLAEPFMLMVEDNGSTAYYENETTYGGDIRLNIEVFDWQFATASTVGEEVPAIQVKSDIFPASGTYDIPWNDAIPGSTAYSYIFPVNIEDVIPSGVNGQEIFIRAMSFEPNTYAPDIPGLTGFDYPDYAELCAFTIFEAPIASLGPQDDNPPEVGEIIGPDLLFVDETAVYELTYATDPEDGTNLTILWDNDGDLDFDDDIDGDDTNLFADLNFPVEGWTQVVARAVDSGGLHTDSAPFDVYVDDCPDEIHSVQTLHHMNDAPSANYTKLDSAFMTVGEYAGFALIQTNHDEIRLYDVTQSGSWDGIPFITIEKTYSDDRVFTIDVDDFSGRVVISLMNNAEILDPSLFQVYSVNGAYLAEFSVGENREVCAIDTDDNGDIWIATWENGTNASRFQHYVYQEDAPFYVEDEADSCLISDEFPENNQMFDLTISYTLDRIYAMRGNYGDTSYAPYGEIYCWDMEPDGILTLNEEIQDLEVFPEMISGAYTLYHGRLVDCDIDIDHSYETSEFCRLVLMANRHGAPGHYLAVLDSDLNFIDYTITPNARRYSFSLRQYEESQDRFLLTTGYSSGDVYLFDPPSGW